MTQDDVIQMAKEAGAREMVSSLTHPKGPVTALKFDLDSDALGAFAKLAFEKGRLQGMAQERALWELSKITQELGPIETYIEKKARGEA